MIDGAGKPLSEVEASVLKGDGTALTAITDKRGKADFGTGKWTAINQWLSVKLTYKDKTIYDQVSKAPDSPGMSIATAQQP